MTVKLLVIDDDTAVTDLLSLLLKSQGFEVFATNNSSDGLSMIREIQPALVILDLMMPRIDGITALTIVRSQYSALPILVVSANASPRAKEDALIHGANDFMLRPFHITEMLFKVRNLITDYRKVRRLQARIGALEASSRTLERNIEETRSEMAELLLLIQDSRTAG